MPLARSVFASTPRTYLSISRRFHPRPRAIPIAPVPLCANHPAYVIYTSGSTGTPKGVINTHQNVIRLFDEAGRRFLFDEHDTWTMFHSYTFDFSVWEIWGPLLHGGRLVVVPKAAARSGSAFWALLARYQVTVLNQTPTAFKLLTEAQQESEDGVGDLALRAVVLGGEACSADVVQKWASRCSVFNGYGPTETTVFATMSDALTGDGTPPIGTPLAHTQVLILDAFMQPCPLGVVGELFVAGTGLARGYLNQPGRTAERFVANPFALEPGERLYRTGDLASWRDDGSLLFRGRADGQVKIRGFRIEPGEIESALARQPEIAEAAVVVRNDPAGDQRLVAYLVAHLTTDGTAREIETQTVRERLASSLPHYMIPAAFVVLDALPTTRSGKIDRAALPDPEPTGIAGGYVAPRTPEESLLCQLVADLLGLERVGLADHFFHVGGHSLTAMRLAAQIRDRLGRELPIHAVFEHPVLGDLAKRIGLVTDSMAAFDVLLPIRTTGSLPPLFCLHPGAGLCWPYTNLLHSTSAEQPIYGIQARGFGGGGRLPETLEEVAEESLHAIRRVRPTGPYRLLGWSFGGILAHMIASRLQAAGEQVDSLILFDSYPPPPSSQTYEPDPAAIWREIGLGTNLILPDEGSGQVLDTDAVLALARAQSHILGTFPKAHLEGLNAVMRNNARLLQTPSLDVFDGDVTLFMATRHTPGLDTVAKTPQDWQRYCRGAIRTIPIDTEHHHMLSPEALEQVGQLPRER